MAPSSFGALDRSFSNIGLFTSVEEKYFVDFVWDLQVMLGIRGIIARAVTASIHACERKEKANTKFFSRMLQLTNSIVNFSQI